MHAPNSGRFRCWMCSTVAVLLAAASLVAEDAPDLRLVRAAYVDSVTSIRTARIDQRITWDRKPKLPGGRESRIAQAVELQLTTDGHRQTLLQTIVSANGRRSQIRAVFDGTKYSSWNAVGKMPSGTIGPDREVELASWNDVFHFLGQPRNEAWDLATLLQSTGDLSARWETVDGVSCVKIGFPKRRLNQRDPKPQVRQTVWFDPEAGYLPRRIRLDESEIPAAPPPSEDYWDYRVVEFMQVPSGTASLWLPRVGTIETTLAKMRVEVTSSTLNVPVDNSDFEHTFPDGCFVEDKQVPGRPRRVILTSNQVVAEGPAADRLYFDRVIASSNAPSAGPPAAPDIEGTTTPLSARPSDNRGSLQPYLLGAGITLIGVGAILWARRRVAGR